MATPGIVAVFMGGPSDEHSVSLLTGREVALSLRRLGTPVQPVVIARDRTFLLADAALLGALPREIRHRGDLPGAEAGRPLAMTARLLELGVTRVFLALHGPGGEDGSIQGFLEWTGLPCTGSGVAASALAMDKTRTKHVLRAVGLPTPDAVELGFADLDQGEAALLRSLAGRPGFPLVVKPCRLGSSVGIAIVRRPEDATAAIVSALRHDDRVLVEAFIEGTEVTCAVLDDGTAPPRALPVIEIIPRRSGFFDWASKYEPGGADEIVPARIPTEAAAETARVALRAHAALGCAGLSRTDAILRDGVPWILEVNTIPGLTPASLSPKAAAAAGLGFDDLVAAILRTATTRHSGSDTPPRTGHERTTTLES